MANAGIERIQLISEKDFPQISGTGARIRLIAFGPDPSQKAEAWYVQFILANGERRFLAEPGQSVAGLFNDLKYIDTLLRDAGFQEMTVGLIPEVTRHEDLARLTANAD